eukprot:6340639-Amphidinium_carterae.1
MARDVKITLCNLTSAQTQITHDLTDSSAAWTPRATCAVVLHIIAETRIIGFQSTLLSESSGANSASSS